MTLDLTNEGTTQYVALPSGKVKYNVAGSGPAMVFLHGSGPGATGWSNFGPNIVDLAEHFTCYAPDMPGWGDSDPVEPARRDHVQTALEFLDALGIEKAAFVGNSMGGGTTIRFAILHPERMSHLITMGAGSSGVKIFGAGDGPSEGLKILRKGYAQPSMETMLELVDVMSYDSGDQREFRAQQRLDSLLAHPEHAANFLEGVKIGIQGSSPSTEQEIAGISAPALLIHGRDDRVVHYENSLRLVSLIQNSRLYLFNRCGHWAQVEHAQEFNRVVADLDANN